MERSQLKQQLMVQHLQSVQEPLGTSTLSTSVEEAAHGPHYCRHLQLKKEIVPMPRDHALPTSLLMHPSNGDSLQHPSSGKSLSGHPKPALSTALKAGNSRARQMNKNSKWMFRGSNTQVQSPSGILVWQILHPCNLHMGSQYQLCSLPDLTCPRKQSVLSLHFQ